MSEMSTISQEDESSSALIQSIVKDLFSYDLIKRRRILEFYFLQDAVLTSPIFSIQGLDAIQSVYDIWQTLNLEEPTITNVVFDGRTAVIHHIHNIKPIFFSRILRFTRYSSFLQIPAITTLHFLEHEQSGLAKVYKQEDSWTLEGLLQAIPFVDYIYTHVLRVATGKMLAAAGDMVAGGSPTHRRSCTLSWQSNIVEKYEEEDDDPWVEGGDFQQYTPPDSIDHEKFDAECNMENELVDGVVLLED